MSQTTAMLLSPRRLVLCYVALALLGLVLMAVASTDRGPDPADQFDQKQVVSENSTIEAGWVLIQSS